MDFSPYLSAISSFYRLTPLGGTGKENDLKRYLVRRRGILPHAPFVLALADVFYLPENEHKLREAVESFDLTRHFRHRTPCVLVLCSYNGMVDLSHDDLRSVTPDTLINYLLIERESGDCLGQDTFFKGGSNDPARIRQICAQAFSKTIPNS